MLQRNYSYAPALWPSLDAWNAILRGVSMKLGLSSQHTIICHLAQRAAHRHGIPYSRGLDYVNGLLAEHAGAVALECGLRPEDAAEIRRRVRAWLSDLSLLPHYSQKPSWPTREQWLAIDRAAAGHAFYDSRHTLSATLAFHVARLQGIGTSAATRWVHERIAHHTGQLARQVGFNWFTAAGIEYRLTRSLNSFE